jgi:hypothetical protein
MSFKANRNDLAHGFKSFAGAGKDKTAIELLEIKNKTVCYSHKSARLN